MRTCAWPRLRQGDRLLTMLLHWSLLRALCSPCEWALTLPPVCLHQPLGRPVLVMLHCVTSSPFHPVPDLAPLLASFQCAASPNAWGVLCYSLWSLIALGQGSCMVPTSALLLCAVVGDLLLHYHLALTRVLRFAHCPKPVCAASASLCHPLLD